MMLNDIVGLALGAYFIVNGLVTAAEDVAWLYRKIKS